MAGGLGTTGGANDPREAMDSRWAWQLTLHPAGPAAGLARQATREVLASWRVAHLEETAVLLVSELVTNSVRHADGGGSGLALRLQCTDTALRIEVHDRDPRRPRPGAPAELDESGFGLLLVDALARSWGVSDTATGKAVWAELDA
jgi:serine/threonine-protein kinase RsbW